MEFRKRFELETSDIAITDQQWETLVYAESESELIDNLDESVNDMISYSIESLKGVWKSLKEEISYISDKFNIAVEEIKIALSLPYTKEMLKAFGYSFVNMSKAILSSVGLVGKVCHDLFEELQKYGFADDIDRGMVIIDKYLDNHPVAKKIGGTMVATTLIYIWLSMTFTGRVSSDMNLKNILLALGGKYTLSKIFATPEGKMMLFLFGTGSFVTFPWLGASAGNLALAVVYTGFVMANQNKLADKIRSKIKTGKKIKIK